MAESNWWKDAWSGDLCRENHLVMVRDTLTTLLLPLAFFCLACLYAIACGTRSDNRGNEQVQILLCIFQKYLLLSDYSGREAFFSLVSMSFVLNVSLTVSHFRSEFFQV
jgi:hypothetical protein